jgi:hypothetical protein
MRHETQCDQIAKGTCDYEGTPDIGEPADFDRALGECPKCKRGKLVRKNDSILEIQEGAAKSYLALYEHSKPKDMVVLDRTEDIYNRIYNMISPLLEREDSTISSELRERMVHKIWEVKYTIMRIWREKREQNLVTSWVKQAMLLAGEEDWDKIVPVEPWRTKIRELYELCKKELEGAGK